MRTNLPLRSWYRNAALLCVLPLVASCGTNAGEDSAEDFPSRNMEMVVHVSPGGGWDTVSRAVADMLPAHLSDGSATMGVTNRTGGSGIQQYGHVVADDTGHRMGPLPLPGIAAAAAISPDAVDLAGARPLGSVGEEPYVVVASQSSGITSIEDLAERDSVTVGSSAGTTGGDYFVNVIMEASFGGDWSYVNHEGSTEAALAAIRGDIDIITQPLTSISPQLSDENLVPLLVFADEPVEAAPEVPLAADSELTTDISELGRIYRVFFVSSGTPDDVTEELEAALKGVVEDPAFIDRMETSGSPASYMSPEDVQALIDELAEVVNTHGEQFIS